MDTGLETRSPTTGSITTRKSHVYIYNTGHFRVPNPTGFVEWRLPHRRRTRSIESPPHWVAIPLPGSRSFRLTIKAAAIRLLTTLVYYSPFAQVCQVSNDCSTLSTIPRLDFKRRVFVASDINVALSSLWLVLCSRLQRSPLRLTFSLCRRSVLSQVLLVPYTLLFVGLDSRRFRIGTGAGADRRQLDHTPVSVLKWL